MKKFLILITTLAVSPLAFSSTLHSLDKKQFNNAFVNKTAVSISYDDFHGHPMGASFSYYLDGKGNIFGKLSKKPNNEPQMDTGTYYILEDGTGYFKWKHWYGGKKICFHIFNTKNAYISVDCNNMFHTVYMKNSIQHGNQVNK
jgi:hypothetical protein